MYLCCGTISIAMWPAMVSIGHDDVFVAELYSGAHYIFHIQLSSNTMKTVIQKSAEAKLRPCAIGELIFLDIFNYNTTRNEKDGISQNVFSPSMSFFIHAVPRALLQCG